MDNKKNLIAKLLKPLIGFLVLMLAFEIILFELLSHGFLNTLVAMIIQIIVIGTYIKRRNNLIFVGVQRGSISVQELRLCLNESAENLCLYGAECSALIKGDGQLSIEQATAAYSLFEAVVEAELESLRSLLVSIEVGEALHMNLCISGEAPLRHLKDPFPALEWEEDEDGLQYVMLRVEKSGGK